MSRSAVQELAGPVEAAIAEVGGDGVQARLERPADPAHGDYATAAALQLAKPLRAAPRPNPRAAMSWTAPCASSSRVT